MLSAGKDSTALLLALHRIGRKDVVCVTYKADYREPEAALASAFARERGFRHITVSPDPKREFDAYVSFLRATPHLTLDFALPAALVVVAACAEHGAMVLDGSGNDKYMHYSPTRREQLLRAISLPSRLGGVGWGAAWLPELGQRTTYVASSTGMYASERWFPGTKLSAKVISQLTGSAEAAHSFAGSLDRELSGRHIVDAVTVAKGRYSDYSGGMEKTRITADHLCLDTAFPFCDRPLIDYYFNLPNGQRFNDQTSEAKLAFKQWLAQQPLKSEYFSIKASYRYNMAAMFQANYDAIVEMMVQSGNIDFTPALHRLFSSARYDYFRAQQAYLIFSFIVWADAHGFALKGCPTDRGVLASS
jgi:Asparagine synthase